jgi:hypothetical protein
MLEPFRAEGGLFAESDDEAFQSRRGLMRAVFGAAGEFRQCGRFARDLAAQPLADSVTRAAKLAGGGALLAADDPPQAASLSIHRP